MTNQIAVRLHCKPGDEFICESGCHIYNYEQAAFAQLSGVVARTVPGKGGIWKKDQLEGLIRPVNEHQVRTRMVTIENTHNRGAGRVQPYETVVDLCAWAHHNGLATHLDGARLFNAVAATGINAADWSQHFDTISICFSKGLGAPVGSVLAGPYEMIQEARRHRKLFGGGMRQAGMIAAGALYALLNNRERLREDHDNAQVLASAVRRCEGLRLQPDQVDTNMVIFTVDADLGNAQQFVDEMASHDVHMLAISPTAIRAVTHLDVTAEQVQQVAKTFMSVAHRLG